MTAVRAALFATIALLATAAPSAAQGLAPAPAESWGTNDNVNAVAQSGSKVYLGGEFTAVGPVAGSGTAFPLGSDQHIPLPSIAGSSQFIAAAVADGSGGWYIGGSFTHVGGIARRNLAHIRADGSVDPGFDPSPDGTVRALSRAGGTLFVGGNFTTISGEARTDLAAFSTASGALKGWAPQTGAVSNVSTLLASGDGPNDFVYIGGFFTEVGGEARNDLARVDAIDGEVSTWAPDPNGFVDALALDGSELYVGGRFTTIAGASRGRVAAFDTSGSTPALDADWNPDANGNVFAFAVWHTVAGSRLYAGGDFTTIGGGAHARLAAVGTAAPAVHTDTGAHDASWTPGANGTVRAIALDGSTVHVAGSFQTVNGEARGGIAAVDDATGATLGWDPRLADHASSAQVFTLATSGTRLYAGGVFALANTVSRSRRAAFDSATGAATGWNPGADSNVTALAASGGTVYAGGDFDAVGGMTRHHAAAIDAADATVGAWHPDPDGAVRAIAVAGSVAYLGGSFANAGGAARANLAAVAADPSAAGEANGWHPDPSGGVHALAASASTVYIGGSFTGAGGGSNQNLAAVQAGGTGAAVPGWQADADSQVRSLALAGGRLYAGGMFESITHTTATTRHYIAALAAADGSVQGWNPDADWEVQAIAPAGDSVFVGGGFSEIGGATRYSLAELDATSGQASSWGPFPDFNVRALALDSAGALHAGGEFREVDDLTQPGYARFDGAAAAPITQGPGTNTQQQQQQPVTQPQQTPAADRTPPAFSASALRRLAGGRLVVYVTASEDATVRATGRVTIGGVLKLGRAVKNAPRGKRVKLTLKVPKAARKRIAAALARRKRATAIVKIAATDRAGNAAKRTLRVKLKRR
jgi:hypothetical protein